MCRRSTSATLRPSFAAWIAAFCPAGPEPITIRSQSATRRMYRIARAPWGTAAPAGATVGREMALRVVIADDSLLIREGVARVLANAGLQVVGRAGDAAE